MKFTVVILSLLLHLIHNGVEGQQLMQTVNCHACDSVQMPECADPFTQQDSYFTCDYTKPVVQIGRALRMKESDIQEVRSGLRARVLLPQREEDLPPGQCAKFTVTKEGHPPIVIRGCSRHGNNTCAYVRAATELFKGALEKCDICSGDLCNSSPAAVSISSVLLFISYSLFRFI